jgi:hypothetical protein
MNKRIQGTISDPNCSVNHSVSFPGPCLLLWKKYSIFKAQNEQQQKELEKKIRGIIVRIRRRTKRKMDKIQQRFAMCFELLLPLC